MPKLSALCCLVLALALGACADTIGSNPSPLGAAAGSDVAMPTARQAGVIGR